jgi:hypothetical protein
MNGRGTERRGGALAIALILSTCIACPELTAGSGSTYSFLRSETGARAAALAGSFVSVTNDPNSIFYNPAALATIEGSRGSVGFFKHLLDINGGHLSYSQEFEGAGRFGGGIIYLNYGDFTETDEAGNELGTFGAGDLAAMVGYAGEIEENLTWGANLKLIYSAIAGSHSTAVGMDAGILFRIPEQRLALGLSVRNLGTQLSSYLDTREELPIDIAAGVSIIPKGLPLLLNVNIRSRPEEWGGSGSQIADFTIGGEFTLSRVLQLRFGYDNALRKDLKVGTTAGLAGFASGLGIAVGGYNVDYSITLLGPIGNFHRLSISTSL